MLKTQDDRRSAKWVFSISAVLLPLRMGYQRDANGSLMGREPCRGATRWSILRRKGVVFEVCVRTIPTVEAHLQST